MTKAMPGLAALLRADDGTLAANGAIFSALTARIEALSLGQDGPVDPGVVAFWAQTAAHFAWLRHPGLHASGALEEAVARLAIRDDRTGRRPAGAPARVVHVLTQALSTGGHTRLAWRWIEADSSRRSSVVLTGQGWHPIPSQLTDAVSRSGGSILDLAARPDLLMTKARQLRRALATADLVVLHIHPFDVVPILALTGWDARPPVLYLNHADHIFWVGRAISDVVVGIRRSGADLARTRRGIDPERSTLLAIPLGPPLHLVEREAARASLGLQASDVAVVSVASAYKFAPSEEADYLATMERALDRLPALRVLVVGPAPSGRWADAEGRTNGRLRALGVRLDLDRLFGAADIYVDSMPLGSLTSLLEAGAAGLPVIVRAPRAGIEVLSVDSPGLDETAIVTHSTDDVVEAIADLAADPGRRSSIGAATGATVRDAMTGQGWLDDLEAAYAKAVARRAAAPPQVPDIAMHADELDVRLAGLHDVGAGLGEAVLAHLRYAPLGERVRVAMELTRAGHHPTPRSLAPDWARSRIRPLVGTRRG